MKAIFISYNQALSEKVDETLNELFVRDFTMWTEVKGRGSKDGESHMGTHTWPTLNNCILTIIADEQVEPLLNHLTN